MSRDMRDANRAIFAHLEHFCARKGEPIPTAGQTRWVRSDDEDKRYLKELTVGIRLQFGRRRALAHLSLDAQHYIAVFDFEIEPSAPHLQVVEANGGLLTALLAELRPDPVATPAQIRNIVEVGSKEEAEPYGGHEADAIQGLFPSITILECSDPVDEDAIWRLFLLICAQECGEGSYWLDPVLADAIMAITDVVVPNLPYAAMCRSMFDADPRGLFMALYRCLEATYAYESSVKLVMDLQISVTWQEMATALEAAIGWRPNEAAALNSMLQHAFDEDLRDICAHLSAPVGNDLRVAAGRAIYSLRNSVVHYRSGFREVSLENGQWNQLCVTMVNVVFHVFSRAYA